MLSTNYESINKLSMSYRPLCGSSLTLLMHTMTLGMRS